MASGPPAAGGPSRVPQPAGAVSPAPPADPTTTRIGAWVLIVLALLLATGLPLAFRYDPDPARAHTAVAGLTGAWGWLRGAHAWFAHAAVALVLAHAARGYVTARTQVIGRARTMAGLVLLALVLAATLSGTILPWDQQGWEAYQHVGLALEATGSASAPLEPGGSALGAVFWGHVLALPIGLVVVLAWHLRTRWDPRKAARRAWGLVRGRGRALGGILVAGLALAVVLPPELGPAPIGGLTITNPDWPFLWLVPLQDVWGPLALWLLPVALVAAAAGAAWGPKHGTHTRRAVVAVAGLAVLVLSVVAWR